MPHLTFDREPIAAIIDGYCQHHMLTSTELERMPDAIQFRALVYGACRFADAIRKNEPLEMSSWWQQRYNVAEMITEQARQYFDR
jgi:Ser/Thr protein kinase RdoA (MazF antagonist)